MASDPGGLHIVLTSVRDGSGNARARAELARIFSLDDRVAGQIIERAPIILIRDVPEEEVALSRGGLDALGGFGIEVSVTRTPPPNAPKVNWPARPRLPDLFPVTRAGGLASGEFTFTCPCCGEVFAVRRLGAAAPAPFAAAAPAAAPAAPAYAPTAAAPEPVPALPALAAELYWGGAEEAEAIPLLEAGEDGIGKGPAASPAAPAKPSAAPVRVVEEVAPVRSGGEELEELEPIDLGADLGGGEELAPIAPPKSGPAAGKRPTGGIPKAPASKASEDEGPQPWTGRARDYQADAKGREPAPAAAPSEDEDELQPWTGRARDYRAEKGAISAPPPPTKPGASPPGKRPTGAIPKPAPAPPPKPRAPDPGPEGDLEELPEMDLSEPSAPLVAKTLVPTEEPEDLPELEPLEKPAAEDEELPELEPLVPARGAERKPLSPPGKRPTGAIPKPGAAPAKSKGAVAEGSGEYSVFLSKITGGDKKQAAIELLAEIKGISEGEAADLCGKMIIPVAKGVSKDEADSLLARFAEHKIFGKITKKR
ncbi:MAG: hypothetical protein L0216_12475 [Planctomycetales bacterium]|nr:hypothetical protein [Planctomycetales bacterium]